MAEVGPGWLRFVSATRSAPVPSLVKDRGFLAKPRQLLATRWFSFAPPLALAHRSDDLVPLTPNATALVTAAMLLLPGSLTAQQQRRQSRIRQSVALQRSLVVVAAAQQQIRTIVDPEAENEDLPLGWEAVVDPQSGGVYYAHRGTREVTWDRPTEVTPLSPLPPPPPWSSEGGESEAQETAAKQDAVVQKQDRKNIKTKSTASPVAPPPPWSPEGGESEAQETAAKQDAVVQKQDRKNIKTKSTASPVAPPPPWSPEGGESEAQETAAKQDAVVRKQVRKTAPIERREGLMLVDAHACLYAAYWATVKLKLQNERGEGTGAILAFANLMRAFLREVPVSHLAVIFDSPGAAKTRQEILPEYKTNRNHPPDEFKQQVGKAKEMCEAFGWSYREETGYEADDLIHTFATSSSEKMRVHIISIDKDLAQLVGPNVVLHRDTKSPKIEMNAEDVVAKWGVSPDQIGDYLAMVGDPSDCIPGVPGVGSAFAKRLLKQHGTLERVIQAAENNEPLPPRVNSKTTVTLLEYREHVRQMREIIALKTVPGLAEGKFLDELRIPEFDEHRFKSAVEFCKKENLKNLAARLELERLQLQEASSI